MNTLTYRDVVDILNLLKESEHCTSLDIELGELRFSMRRHGDAAPPTLAALQRPPAAAQATPDDMPPGTAAAQSGAAAPSTGASAEEGTFIRAPLLGTFYRTLEPSAPPCVKVGDMVTPETTVGLIEVMKLYTTVTAGVSGRITKVLVDSGELVEHNQPLFCVGPA